MQLETVTDTLFINLFGGPGVSKSTTAAGVFYRLKSMNINAELIGEYAKDKTWNNDMFTLGCQPYVTSKQLYRQYRVNGQVDIAVTDSPFILGLAYPGFGDTPSWKLGVLEQFKLFNNLNIFLERNLEVHSYNPRGRNQSAEQAVEKDKEIKALLIKEGIPFYCVDVQKGMGTIDDILEIMEYENIHGSPVPKAYKSILDDLISVDPMMEAPKGTLIYYDYVYEDKKNNEKVTKSDVNE